MREGDAQDSIESRTLWIDPTVLIRLFDHQITGICFLFNNFKGRGGCILADDMGLGKTVQISAYITSLKFEGFIYKVFIVVLVILLDYWEGEIERWTPKNDKDKRIKVFKIYGT